MGDNEALFPVLLTAREARELLNLRLSSELFHKIAGAVGPAVAPASAEVVEAIEHETWLSGNRPNPPGFCVFCRSHGGLHTNACAGGVAW